jgi:hypothetical protein
VRAISPPAIGTLGDESGSQRLAVCRTRQDSHDLSYRFVTRLIRLTLGYI